MAIEYPSEESIVAVLRNEMRVRPVRLALLFFFMTAAAMLMPSAEVHKVGIPVSISDSGQIDVKSSLPTCPTVLESLRDHAETALNAQTESVSSPLLKPPQMVCFPENAETDVLFR